MSFPQRQASASELPPGPLLAGRIARNLVHHRERAGFTQAQLAEGARVSRATITLIESGHADPKLSTLNLLASALGIQVSNLID